MLSINTLGTRTQTAMRQSNPVCIRRSRRCLTPVIAISLLVYANAHPIPAHAREETAPLRLEDAVQQALTHSPELKVLRAAVNVAEARSAAASDLRDPELRVRYGSGTTDDRIVGTADEDGDEYQVGIRLFPPNPWTRSRQKQAETARLNTATAEIRAAEDRVEGAVRTCFAEARFEGRDRELVAEQVLLRRQGLDKAREGATQGQLTRPEVMTKARLFLEAASERDEVDARYHRARQELAALLGTSSDEVRIDLDADAFPLPSTGQPDPEEDPELRGDLEAAQWRVRAAESAYRVSKASSAPWFQHLQVTYADQEQSDGLTTDESEEWRIDLAVNLPVFAWGNHERDLRRMEIRKARAECEQLTEQAETELQNAREAMRAAQKRWKPYDLEIADVVAVMEDMLVSEGHEESGLPPAEEFALREELIRTQRMRLRKEYEFRKILLQFEEAHGAPLPETSRLPEAPPPVSAPAAVDSPPPDAPLVEVNDNLTEPVRR